MGKVNKNNTGDFITFQFLVSILIVFLSGKSTGTDTLTQSQGISVGKTLISSGEMFELGFFSPKNTSKQYLGIWFRNISDHKIVWVANRDKPISTLDTNSSLSIGKDGNLRLLDGFNNTIWSTNASVPSNTSIAILSDKGDFSLFENKSRSSLWESFSNPSGTFVAGMSIGADERTGERISLSSWRTDSDPSVGSFIGGLTTDTPPQAFIYKSTNPYWRSGPWDGWRFTGIPNTGVGYSNGLMVTQDNQKGSVYLTYNPPTLSRIMLLDLTPDGILEMSHWDISSGMQDGLTWKSIKVPCDVYGSCGAFGFCDRNGSNSCECLKGFAPKSTKEWKVGNWADGCVRRTELQCEKNASALSSSKGNNDGFFKLSSMKLPDNYTYVYNVDNLGCKELCSSNCSCQAYAFPPGIGCLVWLGDLIDTEHFSSTGQDVFLRVAYSELEKEKKNRKLVIGLTTVSCVIFFGVSLFGLCWWKARRKGNPPESSREQLLATQRRQAESSDLPMFDFDTLAVATKNFNETNKLGGGGFGPVYKGNLEDGREIAVKRLSSLSGQGAQEFKNEILLISKLQHRNLVRLLGYCIKGDEKLLIYEYLKNRSLDNFLFESGVLLDWDKRLNIIQGIARGLLYLHRDSRLRIIHRDLKASNILLNDNMDPKISDFGLARAFQITQELANTHRVVGTFGYMSPEYAMGGLFSEKSDVFSFGILLLEIISGKRNTSFYNEEKYNLLGYAWNLWKEGRPLELMDESLSISCPDTEFIQCMHIGLLCIQDHAMDRPNMAEIALMLTSEMDLPLPKPITFYQTFFGLDIRPQSSSSYSVNEASVSVVDAR